MPLEKAIISDPNGGDSFAVQFNPTTLRLTLANRTEGGQSTGKEVRQNLGNSSTTLAVDLIFDTADEGSTASPVSVRIKTKKLEKFLAPKGTGANQKAPPRIKFVWGDLIVEGVTDSLTIDFDHFAANGAPLRAKVSLSIRGQDRDKELTSIADSRAGAPPPGEEAGGGAGAGPGAGGGAPGSSPNAGGGSSPSVGVALGGESASEFAARVGVDPAAWRGLDIGAESSLSLSAGVEVGFSANLSASAGLGVTVGVEAGISVPIEASFGLTAGASTTVAAAGVKAGLASGFALASAGGVTAAIEAVKSVKIEQAETKARAAFNVPPKSALPAASRTGEAENASAISSTISTPQPPDQTRTPLVQTGLPTPTSQQAARPAPLPPRADQRSSSFGFGVPLRSTVGAEADRRAENMRTDISVRARIGSGDPPTTADPTKAPWIALPAWDAGRSGGDSAQRRLRPKSPCGCRGRCGH